MVVPKACLSLLLGLDVMKPLGVIIDLKQDVFSFDAIHVEGPDRGPVQGQTFFPDLDYISPEDERLVSAACPPVTGRMSNRQKLQLQLTERLKELEKKIKRECRFPEDAHINPSLTAAQRQMVLDILQECKAAFVTDSKVLPCTDLVEHHIDTGDCPPIYVAPYHGRVSDHELLQIVAQFP